MPFVPIPTQKLDPLKPARETGIFGTRGGYITLDEDVGECFMQLHLGTGGNVVVKGIDGNFIPFYNKPDGSVIAVKGIAVVTTDGTITTSASNITWVGGQ